MMNYHAIYSQLYRVYHYLALTHTSSSEVSVTKTLPKQKYIRRDSNLELSGLTAHHNM